jgi:hypothetical protein
MEIVIFGATGVVGSAITKEALAQGYKVTVLTRDAKRVKITNDNLTVVEGEVTDRATVRKVLGGQDAVIQSLGIGGKGNGKPTTFVSDANKLIMEEMKRMNVRRLIAISVIGAGDSLYFLPWIYRKMIPVMMKWFKAIIDDKDRMEPMIGNSGLDWTIVRCTTVKNTPSKGHITASMDGKGIKYSITAADMAKFVVSQLVDDRFRSKAPVISN